MEDFERSCAPVGSDHRVCLAEASLTSFPCLSVFALGFLSLPFCSYLPCSVRR